MIKILLYVSVFLAAFFGVEVFRRWSRSRNILDVPNERSSHVAPTPRGGGLVIGLICLSVMFGYCSVFQINYYWSYFIGALIIVSISWLDDLFSISVFWRFLCHGLAAFFVVWNLGWWESVYLPFFGGTIQLGGFGIFFTFLWIVWMVNAYNFMDGIDGIAALQAAAAGIGWLVVGILSGRETAGFYGGVIAFSSLGFLIHNWQPAKIFMGDVGSAFLGFSFATLPLLAKNERAEDNSFSQFLPLIGASLVWLFLFDTLLTIFRRIITGEKVWQAHRGHIYQKLVISGYTHRFVSILYGAASILTIVFFIYALQPGRNLTDGLIFLMIFQALTILGVLYFTKQQPDLNN
jgi:UDP-N-acetylmuramyl pentapeptide phosphotransferase/UDP-N-acetylglucosamine-1-phosphate transferase